MPATDYPPGDTPPPLLSKGPGFDRLNELFGWLISMVTIPADASLVWTPGTPESPGRLRSTATGSGSTAATPPLTIVKADAKDAQGAAHPGRVRVYNGFLGNLLPAEMQIPDAVLPGGTDNRCYLTMQNGGNYVYGKVLVDAGTGRYAAAHVYSVTSDEEPDGTYAYLFIGYVTFDGTTLVISQAATGNQQLFITFSVDGTIIAPIWTPTSP